MTGKRRSTSQRVRDRLVISDLYLQGWIQADIGDRLKIDQTTVGRDLKALQAEWLKSTLRNFDEMKAQELAKVDRLEREYWRGWERSCQDAETVTSKTKGKVTRHTGEDGAVYKADQPAETSKTAKVQAGDPRFLAGVERCIERRCKILGIDAATNIKVSGHVTLVGIDPDGA